MTNDLIPIQNMIYEVRGHKVMLDSDLAFLYEVEAKRLNEAVKRNLKRFPEDFMFQLTKDEFSKVVANCDHLQNLKYRPTLPYVFTEQGVAMLAAVLNSQKAIDTNIQIMRTFVKIRQFALEHKELVEHYQELKNYFIQYAKDNNAEIDKINEAINLLMDRTKPAQIGFKVENKLPYE